MQSRRHFRRTAISTGVLSLVTGLFSASLSAQTTSSANTDQQLAPVVVQSTHIDRPLLDTPASVSIVDGDRLKTGAFQVNLSENLVDVPGLLIKNRNNYAQDLQINIRGFGSRSTFGLRGIRLYVDNIPQTMPDGQGQSSNIDIASIDHIEVLRGPFSALYGNSSGGVIQVFTKPGEGPLKVGATVATGSNGSHKYGLEASGGTDNKVGITDYRLSTNRFDTDGFREHSAATRYLSNARIGIALADDSNLVVTANSVYTKADDPLGITASDYAKNWKATDPSAVQYNTRKVLHQTQAGFDWTKQINADNQLELIGYGGQRSTVQYQSIPKAIQNQNMSPGQSGGVIDLERTYAGLDARWTSNLSLADRPFTLVTGLAYDWMKEGRKGYQNFIGNQLGVEGALQRDERNTMWNLDPYVQTSWKLTDRLDMDLGARYSTPRFKSQDYYLSNGDNSGSMSYKKFLPMGAIHYALTKDVSVYATAGKGFETPTMSEFSYSLSGTSIANGWNYNLKPAVSNNVEIGTKANTDIGNLTLALFKTKTDNDIVPEYSSGGRSTFQNADTKRKGIEISWDKTFLHHAHARAAYTWLDAVFSKSFTSTSVQKGVTSSAIVDAGTSVPGISKNMVSASLDWTPPEGFLAGVQWQYMAKMYANNTNSVYAPSYTTTSVYTGYRFNWQKWDFGAMARVDNVFDKKYIGSVIVGDGNERYYEPANGRNWMVSVSANYHF